MIKASDKFRQNAQNCLLLAEEASNAQAKVRFKRMSRAWYELATEQDWLDGHPSQADRAGQLAGDALGGLSDKGATTLDVNDRKSQLIDGPAEFRDSRMDND